MYGIPVDLDYVSWFSNVKEFIWTVNKFSCNCGMKERGLNNQKYRDKVLEALLKAKSKSNLE